MTVTVPMTMILVGIVTMMIMMDSYRKLMIIVMCCWIWVMMKLLKVKGC